MEVWVHLECECQEGNDAENLREILSCLATGSTAEKSLGPLVSDASIRVLECLYQAHPDCFMALEKARTEQKTLNAYWVVGWEADAFVVSVARLIHEFGAKIKRLVAKHDEEVIVCTIQDSHILSESFDTVEDYLEQGFSHPRRLPLESRSTTDEDDVESDVPDYILGRWHLDIENSLILLEEKISQEWESQSAVIRKMFTSPDQYIQRMKERYARHGEKTLEISKTHIVTLYNGKVDEEVPFSLVKAEGDLVEIVEYIEDFGDTEEVQKRLVFSDTQDEFVLTYGKKLLAYRRHVGV
jgi:hypothetical protein